MPINRILRRRLSNTSSKKLSKRSMKKARMQMIKVDRYTCGQHAFFSLHNSENENDLKNMLKSYKLSKLSGRIVFFNAYNDTTGKIWPQLCIELTDAEEIYDYDYDDNLQYNGLEEHICYLPIPFSPVTGERIEFETVSNYNIDADRIKEILAERDAVPKRRSNKNRNKIAKLNEEICKLTKGIADIMYAECEIYDESSVGCAAMVIENLIREEIL